MLKVEFKTGNAAFSDGDGDLFIESSRILRDIANRIYEGATGGKCVDYNGNVVGEWSLS